MKRRGFPIATADHPHGAGRDLAAPRHEFLQRRPHHR